MKDKSIGKPNPFNPKYTRTTDPIQCHVEPLPTPDQDNAILALQFCKDKLIRKLAKLQLTNNGQYYPDDIDQFVKVAKAIVGEMDK